LTGSLQPCSDRLRAVFIEELLRALGDGQSRTTPFLRGLHSSDLRGNIVDKPPRSARTDQRKRKAQQKVQNLSETPVREVLEHFQIELHDEGVKQLTSIIRERP
jgi:hypothetical protein